MLETGTLSYLSKEHGVTPRNPVTPNYVTHLIVWSVTDVTGYPLLPRPAARSTLQTTLLTTKRMMTVLLPPHRHLQLWSSPGRSQPHLTEISTTTKTEISSHLSSQKRSKKTAMSRGYAIIVFCYHCSFGVTWPAVYIGLGLPVLTSLSRPFCIELWLSRTPLIKSCFLNLLWRWTYSCLTTGAGVTFNFLKALDYLHHVESMFLILYLGS